MKTPTPIVPADGAAITLKDGKLQVPANPIIPFIEGDGSGPDIWRAAQLALDGAVQKAYRGARSIKWMQVYAGENANIQFGTWLPAETLAAFRQYLVGIKGPLTTPVGEGIRSINVALRKELDPLMMELMQKNLNEFMVGRIKIDAAKLQHLVEEETWLRADKAIEYGFADSYLSPGTSS